MVITLIGFRGVGKSSVGPQLASRLGWDCADADVEITRRAGKSIPEIFSQDGEPRFRELEVDVLHELLHRDRIIVAAGGGAVMDQQTRRLMRESGPVVWLQASIDTIWSRIDASLSAGGNRPALTDRDPRSEVEWLIRQREPVYAEAAALSIPTDGRTVAAIVDDIASQLPTLPEWPA